MSAFTFSPRAVALARYGSRAIVPFVRQSPRWARRGGRLVRKSMRRNPLAYTLGAYSVGRLPPNFARDARISQVLRNKRTKMALKRRVGERIGSSNAKFDDERHSGLKNPETLYQEFLLNVPPSASGQGGKYGQRQSDQVNFRGIKFCFIFRTEGAIGTAQAFMNVAVISPKANLSSSDTIPDAEFFRNPFGTSRKMDFSDVNLNNLDYRCAAINTDNYNVHARKRLILGPANSTEGRKDRLLEFYMPLKRQIRYSTGSIYPEGKNMYLVYWFSTSDGGLPANSVKVQYVLKKYWRDTKLN